MAFVVSVLAAAAAREPYEVGQSFCLEKSAIIDHYPVRAPLLVADFLLPHVRGKAYVEIGSRKGDIASCLAPHARSVTVVEAEEAACASVRERGINVVCRRVENLTIGELPLADVYYYWAEDTHLQMETWLFLIALHLRSLRRRAVVFVGADAYYQGAARVHAQCLSYLCSPCPCCLVPQMTWMCCRGLSSATTGLFSGYSSMKAVRSPASRVDCPEAYLVPASR